MKNMTSRVAMLGIVLATCCWGLGCLPNKQALTIQEQYSALIGKCLITNKRLMVYEWIENGKGIEISPGNYMSSVKTLGWLEEGSTIWVRRIEKEHIAFSEDVLKPVVEINLNGKQIEVTGLAIFLDCNSKGNPSPNPKWLSPCP
jgi:hypothetical protein